VGAGPSRGRSRAPSITEMTVFELPVPAIAGKHSDRLMTAQTIAPFGHIQQLLGHDPRSPWKSVAPELREVYEKVQRKTDKERKTKLRSYILDRMVRRRTWIGGLPAVAIAVQFPQEFDPSDPKHPEAGFLRMDTSPTNLRVMIDGIARVSAALDTLADREAPQELKEALQGLYIPVTLYMPHVGQDPLSLEELGQLFHDFNVLQATVSKGTAIDLDRSDVMFGWLRTCRTTPSSRKTVGWTSVARRLLGRVPSSRRSR
jgi:hypothetical protein